MKIKKYVAGTGWVQQYPEVDVGSIVATGTPSSSTFLRGDGTWAAPTDVDTNNYLTGVSGSGNGTITFTRQGLTNLTFNAAHTHSEYLKYNPDGDGIAISYDDSNPTINGQAVGGGHTFGADGSLTNGYLNAKVLLANGSTNSVSGYYVGAMTPSTGGSSTQVIDGSGNWVGNAIAAAKLGSHTHAIADVTNLQTTLDGKLSTSGKAADANLLDGLDSTYFDHRRYTDATNYLGGYYVSGGSEKPNNTIFGAGKFKVAMLSGSNLGFGGSWNDIMWLSTYSGGDVKGSHALVFDKYSSAVYTVDQNYDSASWGSGQRLFADDYHPNADKLTTARNIALSGDVTGSANFDGSANISITATVADDSHNHIISNVDGLQTALDAKADDNAVVKLTGNQTVAGQKTFSDYGIFDAGFRVGNSTGTVSDSVTFDTAQTFTGPYLRGSGQSLQRGYYTSQYTIWDSGNDGSGSGLDADLLDGQHGSFYQNASNLNAGTIPAARIPNAGTTAVGGIKARLSGTTLYITNNGTNP